MNKKRNLGIVLGLFSLVMVVGVAWAAVAGVLTFDGTAHLNESVKLDIVNAQAAGPVGAESPSTISVSADGQVATLVANLDNPGESATFTFQVENVGNADAEITDVVLSAIAGDAASAVNVTGTYTGLQAEVVAVNATTGEFTIVITWDSAAVAATGTATFTITMDYERAVS